jgi:hypothetical protein
MKNFNFAALAVVLLAGCRSGSMAPTPKAYFGPTEPMADVVKAINANNSQIPTLWADPYFEATIVDEKGHSHTVNGDAILVYQSPRQLRLKATKAVKTVFDIGSDGESYWMTVPQEEKMWWGHLKNAGKPCAQNLEVRPDLFVEVLGISEINSDFLAEPAPTMRFNNDSDVYMFVWNYRGADRWIAQKEIWYDRKTKLPEKVLLFDANGRIVLRANLMNHRQIELENVPQNQRPLIATEYKLFFPESGSTMHFWLYEKHTEHTIALEHNGAPNRLSFKIPLQAPGVDQVIQLDQNCND